VSRRVLVARLDSVGDVLLAGPAVRAVAAVDAVELWLLCGPRGESAGRLLPGVDHLLVWDSPWISDPPPAVTAAHLDELVGRVRSAGIEEAVILTSFHQSPLPLALLLRLAGVSRITGASVDYAGALLDVRLRGGEDLDEDQPEPERALAIAAAAGFTLPEGDAGELRVLPVPDPGDLVPARPYVVLHPGASVPARTWPAERFRDTARLLGDAGWATVVTGGGSEKELTAAVAGDSGIDLGGRLSLQALAGVLAGAAAVVVGNTGPAHLAAAVHTPVVSLFSPVVPAVRWAPYRVPTALLGDQDAPCAGSRARVCPVPGHPCLGSVTAEEATAACLGLIERAARAERIRLEVPA
jgi:ADP-heptose:LPS heptosyltransferase